MAITQREFDYQLNRHCSKTGLREVFFFRGLITS